MADVLSDDLRQVREVFMRKDPACVATMSRLVWWGLNGGSEPQTVTAEFERRAKAVFAALRQAVPNALRSVGTDFMRLNAAYLDMRQMEDGDSRINDLFEAAIHG